MSRKLKITLPGEEYEWEPDETTLAECLAIESELDGMAWDEWLAAIDDRRAVACQVLIWFLRHKAGNQQDRHAVDFPLRKLSIAVIPDADPEASAASDAATEPSSPPDTESGPGSGGASPALRSAS